MLLEAGFLAIFLCPLWTFKQLPEHSPTSKIIIWAFRWFIFRLLFGMGFNKLTGDPCWRNFTCMEYHHETQMLPNPISYYLHQMPSFFHTLQTLAVLFFELVVPFFLFMGCRMRTLHGVLQIAFQVAQTVGGNLGFQNWLIIVLCTASFDDATIGLLFPSGNGTVKDLVLQLVERRAGGSTPERPSSSPPTSTDGRSTPPAPHGGSTATTSTSNTTPLAPTVPIKQDPRSRRQRGRGRSRLRRETEQVARDMTWFLSNELPSRHTDGVLHDREGLEAGGSKALERPPAPPARLKRTQSGDWTRSTRWDLQALSRQLEFQLTARPPFLPIHTRETSQAIDNPVSRNLSEESLRNQEPGAETSREQPDQTLREGYSVRLFVNISLGLLIAYLSLPLLWNELGFPEISENIFRPFRLVSKYRCFSRVTKERTEVILLGTSSPFHDSSSAVWEEYEFKCKPGDLTRRPCFLSPFQYRLDWHMWYAAMLTYEQNEWIIHLAGKILATGNGTSPFLRHNPFSGKEPPRWIKGEHYKYKFSRMGGKHANMRKWWLRKKIGAYFPPLDIDGLKMYFRHRSWPYPPQP